MPKYKVVYFNGRGRAEVTRMLFAQAGQEYEDQRIEQGAWESMKTKTPFGQMPILEVDGVVLCQSNAIARYLAKTFGLAGKTDLEQAKADMIVDSLEDMNQPILSIYMEKDEAKKAELKKKYSEKHLPAHLEGFEKLLKSKFFTGDQMTWADIAMAHALTWPPMVGIDVNLDKYPKVKALKERVETSPKIAEWIQKRPKTDF